MPEGEGTARVLDEPEPLEENYEDVLPTDENTEESKEDADSLSQEDTEEETTDGDAEIPGESVDGMGTEDESVYIRMQPFFGPDKKYGACPYCAAVIIIKNEGMEATCPNCKAELKVESFEE